MLRLFLFNALRNLMRRKVQSLINIASLALGLMVFGFAFLYVKQELSYDRFPEAERVHRLVVETRGLPGMADGVSLNLQAQLWPMLLQRFASQLEGASRAFMMPARRVDGGTGEASGGLLFVDPDFDELFQLQVVDGDIGRVLEEPGFIALEENHARSIGYDDGVGGRLTLSSTFAPALPREYEVAAIYRLPRPLSTWISFPSFTLLHDNALPLLGEMQSFFSWNVQVQGWVKLKPGIDTEAFNALQADFIQQEVKNYNDALEPGREINDHLSFRWQPVSAMHFNPLPAEATIGRGAGDAGRVVTFAVVGLLVLLVGCSNSVGLSLAAALERRREIGIRKTAGALAGDILRQQLGESVLLALLALIPAIALIELLEPSFHTLLPFTAQLGASWSDFALLALVAGSTGLLSGAYPAFVLAATRPQVVLKAGAQESAGTRMGLRGLLVGAQFCFASMLLIGTMALYLQLAVTRAQPLGFDPSNIVVLSGLPPGLSAEAVRNELEGVSGVTGVHQLFMQPDTGQAVTGNSLRLSRTRGSAAEIQMPFVAVDIGFRELMGMKLLAGRSFERDRDLLPSRENSQSSAFESTIVINASAARALGFDTPGDAVDQRVYMSHRNAVAGMTVFSEMSIIGVVEDNMYMSLRRRPGPETYQLMASMGGSPLAVKYADSAEATIQQDLQDRFTDIVGAPPQNIRFMEEQVRGAFVQEQNESRLLLICGGLALLLACIGLYGLAAFSMERRVKEVGVRKALGAGSGSIVALFLLRFARPVLIANILAWPAALYFVLRWIERFPYQLERAWLAPLCIGTALAVLVVAMLTVGYITSRAASVNPVRSLRYE